MLIELLVVFALAAPGEEVVSEPASEADRTARVAYFDSLVKQSALRPCQDRFPAHAGTFAHSHSAWAGEHARLIRDGRKSIVDALGPEAAKEAFPTGEAEAAMVTVLSELPEAERLPWCQEHFPDTRRPRPDAR
jgi:hypothetical protein